ncbi:N-6 DNA methylase [Flavobacterium praedii]|uniref:N-6 DNA methylase n=1 Tax=Flavobacterium praedii TaxID=3002900 RepID=UPI0024819992|nr:N-6 DNA methylase [Flavobacterium praedii]
MLFASELNKISNRHHKSQVFDDFLGMAVCAYSLGKSEDIYLDIAKKYNEEELKGFANALGGLVLDHEKQNISVQWKDFLGNYFEEFGQSNSKMGQFFTPTSICNLMAYFTNDNLKEETQTVNDPSCGSSRNLIAHAMKNPNNRFNFFYVGQDLDKRCCLMSVLNFVMFGLSGVVIYMNCLSLEIYGGWRIYMPETLLGVQPLSVDECRRYLFTEKVEEEEPVLVENFPLTLFDV